jgi:hypothetical protein
MTDGTPAPVFDPNDFMARLKDCEQRGAELHPANKASLMAALRDAGITCVTVTFDGYGDSGQIENVEVKAGDAVAELPAIDVDIARTHFFSEKIERLTQPLADAIETMSYALLEEKHCGWENNQGAYGDIVFDVPADRIVVDFNYRVETSENHTHEF